MSDQDGTRGQNPPSTGDATPGADNTGDPKGGGRTFTQEDVNRLAGEARDKGRRAAIGDLLKELGVEDLETLKGAYKAHTEALEKDKTELQKAQERASGLEGRVETLASERNQLLIEREVERQALALGANPERLAAIVRLREAREGELSEAGKVVPAEVKKSVEAVLSSYPEFKKGHARGIGGGSNPPQDPPQDLDSRIAEAQKAGNFAEVIRLQTQKLVGGGSS